MRFFLLTIPGFFTDDLQDHINYFFLLMSEILGKFWHYMFLSFMYWFDFIFFDRVPVKAVIAQFSS